MPTQKKGCDDDEIVGLFSPQRRLFRKFKAAVLFRAKVSYRLMYILHESAMTPTHSSLGTLSTERIDERNIKAPIATSKCRQTTSEVAWVFLEPPCRPPTGSKFRNVQVLFDILDVCKFTTFCDRKG